MEELVHWGKLGGSEFRAGLVTNIAEMRAVQTLRCRAYCKNTCQKGAGTVQKADCRDHLEFDRCDPHSYHYLAYKDQVPIGCFRGIRCEHGYRLEEGAFGTPPVPFMFPEYHPITGKAVTKVRTLEASRWVANVALADQSTLVLVSQLLFQAMFEHCLRLRTRDHLIFGIVESKYHDLMRLGWPIAELIPGRQMYRGAPNRVCILEVGKYAIQRTHIINDQHVTG